MVTQINLGNFFTLNGKTVLAGAGGSGLNTQELIKSLTEARGATAKQYQDQIDINDKQSKALADFQSLLSAFKSAADVLRNPPGVGNAADNAFKFTSAALSSNTAVAASTYLSVTTNPGAALQSYTVSDITSLATAASQSSGEFALASADASATAASDTPGMFKAGTFTLNGQNITLNTGDSLNTVVAKFNAISDLTNISATLIQVDATHFRVSFNATHTGTDYNFDLADDGTVTDATGVLNNIGIGTLATQNTGIFTIADANTTIVSALPIGGTANQFAPGTITFNGESITLNEGDTLNDVRDAFNTVSADTGVTAAVVEVAAGQFRLTFTANRPGPTHNFDVSGATDPDGVLTGAGLGAPTAATTTATAATNAAFKINGVALTRQSNSISDVVSGVNFNLLQTTPGPGTLLTVQVAPDTVTAQNSIVNFVKDYNALRVFYVKQTQLQNDGTYAPDSVLANNQTFRNIMAELTAQVTSQVAGISGSNPSNLSALGITFTTQPASGEDPEVSNILNINDGTLTSLLSTNFDGVSKLFGFTLTSDNPNLRMFSHTNALAVSEFTLNLNPGANTFTATYDSGSGPVTVNLTAQALPGGTSYTLTGPAGSALDGLKLIYGSTATATINVTATQGIADRMFNTGDTALKLNTGTLPVELQSLKDSDTRLQENIARVNAQVAQYQQQLINQFTALEKAISQVNSLLSALAANDQARFIAAQ